MELAAEQAPGVFGDWDAELKNDNEVQDEITSATEASKQCGEDPG